MHQKEMGRVINGHVDAIIRLTHKAIGHFSKEVIEDLRTEFKKLQAFINLVRTESEETEDLRIAGRLKALRGYTGIIRNIQLQEHIISEILPHRDAAIREYILELNAEAAEWKKELESLIVDHLNFDEERNIVLKALPIHLSKLSIRKFLQARAQLIMAVLNMQEPAETDLHELRKAIKEILYNWTYVQQETDQLLPFDNIYEKLHTLAALLDQYGDQCTALDFLQPAHIAAVKSEKTRQLLELARHEIEKKIDSLKSKILTPF